MSQKKNVSWQEILYSKTLVGKNKSHKIAYIAVMTAFLVVANMFFEFKLAETQFSLTLLISALTGMIIGPIFGFTAAFLGDLVGFLYHSSGFSYMPWIGISLGVTAAIAGLIIGGIPSKSGWFLYVKLALISLLTFGICTVGINTTAFWLLWNSEVDYGVYLVFRLFTQGQIWNSIANYVLLFIAVPALKNIKALGIKLS